MTKQEFLEELKQALSGEVSAEAMMDSYRYYATYIEEEIQSGKTEEQVLEELGKPSLIARSIIAAQSGERIVDEEYTEDGKTRRMSKRRYSKQNKNVEQREKYFEFNFRSWYAKVLYAVIFILFLILLCCRMPLLIVLGIIYLVMYFSR